MLWNIFNKIYRMYLLIHLFCCSYSSLSVDAANKDRELQHCIATAIITGAPPTQPFTLLYMPPDPCGHVQCL
ncbi:hypothetical protein JB92DRAFT_3005734 [Gautieria morchelliformis]|nr:hypothetical protein JB92DRAFT_3005734 [Gautieria morchelliformis]